VLAMRRKGENVEDIADLAGLAKTDITYASILGLLMFSLAGIPPLAGFWAKWYVFLPAIKAGLYPLAVIGVITSVVGAFYYLRIVKIMFFDDTVESFQPRESKVSAVMVLSAGFVILFVLPLIGGTLVDAATAAAAALAPAQAL
jgi:NADH-quinone oxidoreductase subunit N